MNQLLVLETGGTINGIVDPNAPTPRDSRVFEWLKKNGGISILHLQTICMKDSRALDDQDREHLARAIEQSTADRILIPHGTYTMAQTGEYLTNALAGNDVPKVIVLVGSLVPLESPDSDAPACLEFALKTLGEHSAGVWVAMNGQAWHPGSVVKDDLSGAFVARVRGD